MDSNQPRQNAAARQRQVGLVIVAACTSASLAIEILLPLVSGLVNLLRDILGVLILPFSFMFGLGNPVGQSPALLRLLSDMGMQTQMHPWRLVAAAVLELVAVFLFVIAERLGGRTGYMGACLASVGAIILSGLPLGTPLLPAIVTEGVFLLCPPRPTRTRLARLSGQPVNQPRNPCAGFPEDIITGGIGQAQIRPLPEGAAMHQSHMLFVQQGDGKILIRFQ
ncbi:hypothetical protein S101450_00261 [Komagataeibacter saccharivorans]|nr:hypothetical protein S101450_00261 [Komagataeibacter saccharivorans]